jgi:hypothetical protein
MRTTVCDLDDTRAHVQQANGSLNGDRRTGGICGGGSSSSSVCGDSGSNSSREFKKNGEFVPELFPGIADQLGEDNGRSEYETLWDQLEVTSRGISNALVESNKQVIFE